MVPDQQGDVHRPPARQSPLTITSLMLATWMAKLGIKTRIVDKRPTKDPWGRADGITPRTLEIFDSFGFADRVFKEACDPREAGVWVRQTSAVARTVHPLKHIAE